MTISPATNEHPQTCFRCAAIGLPPLGIAVGEPHMLITADTKQEAACLDCYARLREEISDAEGEEWKISK